MLSMTIKQRLLGLGALVLFSLLSIGGIGIYQMVEINDDLENISTNWLPSVEKSMKLRISLRDYRLGTFSHTMADTADEMTRREERLVNFRKVVAEDIAAYEKLVSSDEERKMFDAFLKAYDVYNAKIEDV
ncbi:MAG: hypothetical protein EON60_14310, partial [Alphaproteobacteria bacterium]